MDGTSKLSPTTTFDHRFERVDDHHTALEFVVWTRGLGRLGSWGTQRMLGRALDRSIPRLVDLLRGSGKDSSRP